MLSEILKRAGNQLPAPQIGQMPQMGMMQSQAPQMDIFGQTQNAGALSQALRGMYGGFNRFR